MAAKKKVKVIHEDVLELYQKVWSQFAEDRDLIRAQYKDLQAWIQSSKERYVDNGDTLAKYAELMVKQTAQVMDVLKIAQKASEGGESENFEDDDYSRIEQEIGTPAKKDE